jgi:hypothetical protein
MPVNGEFIGAGRNVQWRAPRLERTPNVYALSVLVTEKYTSNGQPAENRASSIVRVHYNDSPNEIKRIGVRFLTQLFPDFSVSPREAVQDFSDSCSAEKSSELSDVTGNRINFHILSGTYTNVEVGVNGPKTLADVSGLCTFVDIPMDPKSPNYGKRESVSGVCTLTAVYENWQWFLCSSHFKGIDISLLEKSRYRVPGRILSGSE